MCIPSRSVGYLALVGDSSDNIPGVTGVGAKTTARWLEWDSDGFDELVAHARRHRRQGGENLRDELGDARAVRKLATIDTALHAGGLPPTG